MRTLMIVNTLRRGGAEMTALRLAGELRRRDVAIEVAPMHETGPLGKAYRQAGVPLHPPLQRFAGDPGGAWRSARLIRRGRFDTLLLLDALRNLMWFALGGAAMSGAAVRRIVWCHTTPLAGWIPRVTRRMRAFYRFGQIDRIVYASPMQQEGFDRLGVPATASTVIPNGVDVPAIASAEPAILPPPVEGKTVFVQVANVLPPKDFDTLLTAAGRLIDVPVVLCLVGRGTDSPAMRRRIDAAGLSGIVLPLGQRDDTANLLAAADGFVLSTHTEVFNVATLEAMAAGLPLVTTDIRGFDELFAHDVEGLKVPHADPVALAEAIRRLTDDPALRSRLGCAARRRANQFTLARMADHFQTLLTR